MMRLEIAQEVVSQYWSELFLIQELDVEGLRKVCTEVMRGARLQAHVYPTSWLRWRWWSVAPGNRSDSLLGPLKTGIAASFKAEVFIDIENAIHFLFGFLGRDMSGVTLMPVKLGCAQEEFCAEFPAQERNPIAQSG